MSDVKTFIKFLLILLVEAVAYTTSAKQHFATERHCRVLHIFAASKPMSTSNFSLLWMPLLGFKLENETGFKERSFPMRCTVTSNSACQYHVFHWSVCHPRFTEQETLEKHCRGHAPRDGLVRGSPSWQPQLFRVAIATTLAVIR